MSTLKGLTLAQEPTQYIWKPTSGGQTILKFSGTEEQILAKKAELEAAGYDTETTTGPAWKLMATLNVDLSDGGGNGETGEVEPAASWELVPTTFIEGIFDCGRFYNLHTKAREAIEYKLKNPSATKTPSFTVPTSELNSNALKAADMVYGLRQVGVEGRQIYTQTLKRSMVVSGQFTNLTWQSFYTNEVLSTTIVASTYQVPLIISKLMPPSSLTYIYTENSIGGQWAMPFYWGWLEGPPTYQLVGSNRIQIAQEWVYNKWNVKQGSTDGLYDLRA